MLENPRAALTARITVVLSGWPWVSPRHLCRVTMAQIVQPSAPWRRTLQVKEVLVSSLRPLAPPLSAVSLHPGTEGDPWLDHLPVAPALVCSGLASAL